LGSSCSFSKTLRPRSTSVREARGMLSDVDVGARLSCEQMPQGMPNSVVRAIADKSIPSKAAQQEVMDLFVLGAEQCVAEIRRAGREPHSVDGGEVHAMLAFAPFTNIVNYMVNGLHINASLAGEGVDEVVKFLRLTRSIHFFLVFPDGVCGMLTIPVAPKGHYWLWNFSSLMLHYIYLDPEGLYLHHSVGPPAKASYFALDKVPKPAVGKIMCPTEKLGTRPWGREYTIDKSFGELLVRLMGVARAYLSRSCCR